jgi:hypothetical protein
MYISFVYIIICHIQKLIPTKLWPISTKNNYFFRHLWLIDKYVMLSMFMLSFILGDSLWSVWIYLLSRWWLKGVCVRIYLWSHSQKWWILCSFAYLRWRRRDVCNFHMIYLDDIIHNCMCIIFWNWKLYIESSWIKWNEN